MESAIGMTARLLCVRFNIQISVTVTDDGKSPLVVMLSEAKNPSRFEIKSKRDSSRKIGSQNDDVPPFSATCSGSDATAYRNLANWSMQPFHPWACLSRSSGVGNRSCVRVTSLEFPKS